MRRTGLAPCPELSDDSADVYKTYTSHKRGSLNPKLWQPEHCMPLGLSLADAVDSQDSMQIVRTSGCRTDESEGDPDDEVEEE